MTKILKPQITQTPDNTNPDNSNPDNKDPNSNANPDNKDPAPDNNPENKNDEYDYFRNGEFKVKKEYPVLEPVQITKIPLVRKALPANNGVFPLQLEKEYTFNTGTKVTFHNTGYADVKFEAEAALEYEYSWNETNSTLYMELYRRPDEFMDYHTLEECMEAFPDEIDLTETFNTFKTTTVPEMIEDDDTFAYTTLILTFYYKALGYTDEQVAQKLMNLSYTDLWNIFAAETYSSADSWNISYKSLEEFTYINSFKYSENGSEATLVNIYPTTFTSADFFNYGNLNKYFFEDTDVKVTYSQGLIKYEDAFGFGGDLAISFNKYENNTFYGLESSGPVELPCTVSVSGSKVVMKVTINGVEYELHEPADEDKMQFSINISNTPSDQEEDLSIYGYDEVFGYKIYKKEPENFTASATVSKPALTPVTLPAHQSEGFPFAIGTEYTIDGNKWTFDDSGKVKIINSDNEENIYSYSWDSTKSQLRLQYYKKFTYTQTGNTPLTLEEAKALIPDTLTEKMMYDYFMEIFYDEFIEDEESFEEYLLGEGVKPMLELQWEGDLNDPSEQAAFEAYYADRITKLTYSDIWNVIKYRETIDGPSPFNCEVMAKVSNYEWLCLEDYYHIDYLTFTNNGMNYYSSKEVLPENLNLDYLFSAGNDVRFLSPSENETNYISIYNRRLTFYTNYHGVEYPIISYSNNKIKILDKDYSYIEYPYTITLDGDNTSIEVTIDGTTYTLTKRN